MRRAAVQRLADQIAAHDRARRERTLTDAERAFCVLADSRGKRIWRSGWPDFLVEDKDTGGVVAVEVKTGSDVVSPSQAKMFAALEKHGLRVVVWCPERPLVLTPWRRYGEVIRRERNPHGPRLPGSSRAKSVH